MAMTQIDGIQVRDLIATQHLDSIYIMAEIVWVIGSVKASRCAAMGVINEDHN
jgi:hypothetical protein